MSDEPKQNQIAEAIQKRRHAEGLVWMVIQTAPSEPVTDGKGAFVTDESGQMQYRGKEDAWQPLMDHDTPEWVKEPEVIAQLKNGIHVSRHPEAGGRWYRGVICEPAINMDEIQETNPQ